MTASWFNDSTKTVKITVYISLYWQLQSPSESKGTGTVPQCLFYGSSRPAAGGVCLAASEGREREKMGDT